MKTKTIKKVRVSKGHIKAIKALMKDNPKVQAKEIAARLHLPLSRVHYIRNKYLGGVRTKATSVAKVPAQRIIIEVRVIRGRTCR